jgi:hypothetical protein
MAARGDNYMMCKYCCADDDSADIGYESWRCGTYISGDGSKSLRQSQDCKNGELARYRSMFPVPPWDDSPITPEVCERLGMEDLGFDCASLSRWFQTDGGIVSVSIRGDNASAVYGEVPHGWCQTAGQLACLVAARRAST